MRVGTKSVLFGAHQFLIHPWFVAAAWWRLYGFPWDPRLWVAFFVHDLGYLGKPNMDGPEGERHVEFGARVMHWFDEVPDRTCRQCHGRVNYAIPDFTDASGAVVSMGPCVEGRCGRCYVRQYWWRDMALYHSRFYAKRDGQPYSMLCVADKLSIALTPHWLYLPMARATGEIREYMRLAEEGNGGKYATMQIRVGSERQWYADVQLYVLRWTAEHKLGKTDTWTPKVREAETKSGVWK